MAALLAGPAGVGAGRHRQPPVRIRAGSRRPGRARDRAGRRRAGDRRRRRKHVARALRDGQGRRARSTRDQKLQDTTLGWRFVNPAFEARHGVDSMMRPRRTSPTSTASPAPTRTPSRCARSSARRGRSPRAASARELMPVGQARRRRATARRHHAGQARRTRTVARRRHQHHRRQRLGPQRRRLRAAARQRGRRRAPWPGAARPRARHGRAGVPPRTMGIGPVPAIGKLLPRLGLGPGRLRHDRDQRGLRRAGAGGDARARPGRRQPRASTRTAARSRWATRSAPAAHGWPSPRCTNCERAGQRRALRVDVRRRRPGRRRWRWSASDEPAASNRSALAGTALKIRDCCRQIRHSRMEVLPHCPPLPSCHA